MELIVYAVGLGAVAMLSWMCGYLWGWEAHRKQTEGALWLASKMVNKAADEIPTTVVSSEN